MAGHVMRGGPQRLVEHALETSTSEQCIAIVNDSTSANLRWANNTLTTNGVMHSVDVTVIAFQGGGNASVSGTAASLEQVSALVASADRAAAVAGADERDHRDVEAVHHAVGRQRVVGPAQVGARLVLHDRDGVIGDRRRQRVLDEGLVEGRHQ